VKSEAAEARMPDFDFERKVGAKIQLQKFRRSVVLCVVDVAGALFNGAVAACVVLCCAFCGHQLGSTYLAGCDITELPWPLHGI